MPTTFKHGLSAYANGLCKCEVCKRANSQYVDQRRAKRYRHTAEHGLPTYVKHGRVAYINWGCRCEVCREAHSNYSRDYRKKKSNA